MRALIMAAGLGTRLRPLTNTTPKPLVKVLGKPMVEYVLEVLARHGYQEAMINVHYLPEQMFTFVREWNAAGKRPRLEVQDESKKILGTGGALVQAASWLFAESETALLCNADVISDPDLGALAAHHRKLRAKCTMALVPHAEAGVKYNGVLVENGLVTGFDWPKKHRPEHLHFFGYYLINKGCVGMLPPAGQEGNILEQVWKPLVRRKELAGWVYNNFYLDLGTPEDLREAEAFLKSRNR